MAYRHDGRRGAGRSCNRSSRPGTVPNRQRIQIEHHLYSGWQMGIYPVIRDYRANRPFQFVGLLIATEDAQQCYCASG